MGGAVEVGDHVAGRTVDRVPIEHARPVWKRRIEGVHLKLRWQDVHEPSYLGQNERVRNRPQTGVAAPGIAGEMHRHVARRTVCGAHEGRADSRLS